MSNGCVLGRQVEVYWNLHKNCYSVRFQGRVVLHAESILVQDATLVVRPGGRRKVLETGRKNVHAFVRGRLVGYATLGAEERCEYWQGSGETLAIAGRMHEVPVTYNPHLYDSFVVRATCEPIKRAAFVSGGRTRGEPARAVLAAKVQCVVCNK